MEIYSSFFSRLSSDDERSGWCARRFSSDVERDRDFGVVCDGGILIDRCMTLLSWSK